MGGKIDLTKLSHEQLVAMVQARGQALMFHHTADAKLIEKIEKSALEEDDLSHYVTAKNQILTDLMKHEEAILSVKAQLPN